MIKNGMVVDLAYQLKDSNGEVLDEAGKEDPFTYLHGASQIVPGLEAGLEGLKAGDKKNVVVEPKHGYGERDPQLKLVVERTQFPKGADLKTGMRFQANSPDGHDLVFQVEAIEGDKIHIDGNHPMAGETLHFDVEVLSVREATEEEKSHGHAHGPEGHGGHDEHGGHGHSH